MQGTTTHEHNISQTEAGEKMDDLLSVFLPNSILSFPFSIVCDLAVCAFAAAYCQQQHQRKSKNRHENIHDLYTWAYIENKREIKIKGTKWYAAQHNCFYQLIDVISPLYFAKTCSLGSFIPVKFASGYPSQLGNCWRDIIYMGFAHFHPIAYCWWISLALITNNNDSGRGFSLLLLDDILDYRRTKTSLILILHFLFV